MQEEKDLFLEKDQDYENVWCLAREIKNDLCISMPGLNSTLGNILNLEQMTTQLFSFPFLLHIAA